MSIGERINELRKESGLSQVDISKALQVSRQAVSKWENDLSYPDAHNLIQLADLLDTDIEYLATGRRSLGRRPPIVIKTIETVEKIVEKPVIQTVETIIEHVVEKPVINTVEKPVIKRIYRKKYVHNPAELLTVGFICFLAGFLLGYFL